jgi:hypothetical protein
MHHVMDEQRSHINMENMRLRRKINDFTQTVNDLQREIAFLRTELDVMGERIRLSDLSEHEEVIFHPRDLPKHSSRNGKAGKGTERRM